MLFSSKKLFDDYLLFKIIIKNIRSFYFSIKIKIVIIKVYK